VKSSFIEVLLEKSLSYTFTFLLGTVSVNGLRMAIRSPMAWRAAPRTAQISRERSHRLHLLG